MMRLEAQARQGQVCQIHEVFQFREGDVVEEKMISHSLTRQRERQSELAYPGKFAIILVLMKSYVKFGRMVSVARRY